VHERMEGQRGMEVASQLAKGEKVSRHQHIYPCLQQSHVGRLFIKISTISILGLLFFGTAFSLSVQGAQAAPKNATIASMINQVFGADGPAANRVAQCESGENPNAYNPVSVGGSHAEGLFQILYPSTWRTTSQAGQSPYDAQANILAAHEIFVRDGYSWREWTCQPY
jgi:hypothetical protein